MKLNNEYPEKLDPEKLHAALLQQYKAYAAAWAKVQYLPPAARPLAFAQLWFRLARAFAGAAVRMKVASKEE